MKKFTGILLAVVLCFAVMVNALADDNTYKITINGVNVVLTDGKAVLEPIENDGVLYVPLEALLKAMNIEYEVDGKDFTISTTVAEEKPTPTPAPTKTPYDNLGATEKFILKSFLPCVQYFNDPSSLSILDIKKGAGQPYWHGGYLVKISATNKMGGKTQAWFPVCTEDGKYDFIEMDILDVMYVDDGKYSFDIPAINKALKFKLNEMGY